MGEFLDIEWRGREVSAALKRTSPEALTAGGEVILKDAQRRTPVDEGELRDSGKVEVQDDEATISFTADHAIPVHENLEAYHDDGEAKYLERALQQQKQAALEAVAAAIREVLR